MADEKTLKQKTKLLQKLSDYGLKEDKEIIELSIEDEFAMKLTKEERELLIYLRKCRKSKKSNILAFFNENVITNNEKKKGNEENEK